MRKSFVVSVSTMLIVALPAVGQYTTGFEVSDGITASPTGEILTGQDGYYVPSGTDFLAFTYIGNTYNINQNPEGGDQFVAVEGPGGGIYGRAQRDMNWGTTTAIATYDVACQYLGVPPASNNLGSFSVQPYPGSADYIHLFTFVDINDPVAWQAGYLAYDASGVQFLSPGYLPGPEWSNLELNHWYRFTTTLDFTTNQITEFSITDLTTNVTAFATAADVYLEGGSAGGLPLPNGFRMFSGGGAAGNVAAFDNMDIAPEPSGPYTLIVGGTCPGEVVVEWSGATPSIQHAIIYGPIEGRKRIPEGNPCAGTILGLDGCLRIHMVDPPGFFGTGENGAGTISGEATARACGGFLQLIEEGTCNTSNTAQIP